jgi:hypothetical protein
VVDLGEECDDGSANGVPPSCCTTNCTIAPADTVCRPALGECDLPETCGGAKVCPPDQKFQGQCRPAPSVCYQPAFCNGRDDGCPTNPFNDGATCNTGDACTIKDFCQSGACLEGPKVCAVTVPERQAVGGGRAITVSCAVTDGGKCAAQAFAAPAVALHASVTLKRGNGQNGLRPITKKVTKRVSPGGAKVLSLQLNPLGRKLLAAGAGGQLNSYVVIGVTPKDASEIVLDKLIELLRRSP